MKKAHAITLALALAITGLAYAGTRQDDSKDKKCTDCCCCKHDKADKKEGCCKKHS